MGRNFIKYLYIVVLMVITCSLTSCSSTSANAITDNRPANYGNTLGNLGNAGNVVQDGKYFYYATNDMLYKADFTLKNIQPILNKIQCCDLNVVHGWIYYTRFDDTGVASIWKVDVDGKNNQQISDMQPCQMLVVNDKLYVIAGYGSPHDGIYSMNTDGSNVVQLTDANAGTMYMDGSTIYFAGYQNNGYSIYKMNIDGTGKTLLLSTDGNINNLVVYKSYIYYCGPNQGIQKVSINSGKSATITESQAWNSLNICDNTIYYSVGPTMDIGIHALNLDTNEDKVITTKVANEIYIINNKVCFRGAAIGDKKYYIMNLDGSKLRQIN